MTFDTIEDSAHDAEPVYLLRFRRGANKWLYNTSDIDIVFNTEVYEPSEITVLDSRRAKPEEGLKPISLSVPRNHELAELFKIFVPATPVSLTIFEGHVGDDDFRFYWQGEISTVLGGDKEAKVNTTTDLDVLKRSGLPYKHGGRCQHYVYRGGCNLDPEAHKHTVTVGTINGRTIQSSGVTGLVLAAGFAIANGDDHRSIINHVGDVITLIKPFANLAPGDSLVVVDGCDGSIARCKQLNNFENYFAFNTIPDRNPFESGLDTSKA